MAPDHCPMCKEPFEAWVSQTMPSGRVWTWHERYDENKMAIYCGPLELQPVATPR